MNNDFVYAAFRVPFDIPIEQWEYNFRRLITYGGMVDFNAPVPIEKSES